MAKSGRGYRYQLDDSSAPSRSKKKKGVGRYIVLLLVLLAGVVAAYFYFADSKPGGDSGNVASPMPLARKLESVDFLRNGETVQVAADSKLELNPADTLQIQRVKTNGWFSWGVKAASADFEVDVWRDKPVTIKEIWPKESFETPKEVDISFYRWKQPIGKVSLLIRLDARDWLQKAHTASDLERKAFYLEKALAENPGNTLAKTQLAALYVETKNLKNAARLYEEIAKAGKSRPILEQMLVVYRGLNQEDKALEVYIDLMKLSGDPDDFKAFLQYLQKQKSAEEAARYLQAHQQEIPKKFENSLLLYTADLRTRTKDWSSAAAAYERVIKGGNKSADVLYNLSVIYQKGNDTDKAIDALNQYLRKNPGDMKSWMQLAELQEKKGALSQAEDTYEKILQKNPQQKDVILRLVDIAEKSKDKKAMQKAYKRLAELQPNNKTVHFNLGVLYYEQKDWGPASKEFEIVASLDARDLESRRYLLDLYGKLKDSKKEMETLLDLAELEPGNSKYYDEIFKVYDGQKNYKEILNFFQKAEDKNPDSVTVHRYLLYAYLKTGNNKGALKELEQLIRLQPKEKKYLRQAANLYEKEKQYKESLKKLEQLLKLDPKDKESKADYLRLRMKVLQN